MKPKGQEFYSCPFLLINIKHKGLIIILESFDVVMPNLIVRNMIAFIYFHLEVRSNLIRSKNEHTLKISLLSSCSVVTTFKTISNTV